MTLPPLRDWWAELSADAQHAVLDSGSRHLDETVREEIREITGAVVGILEEISAAELEYARAHLESDD